MRSDKHKDSPEYKKILEERGREIEDFNSAYNPEESSKPSYEVASARNELEKKAAGSPVMKDIKGRPAMASERTGENTAAGREAAGKAVAGKTAGEAAGVKADGASHAAAAGAVGAAAAAETVRDAAAGTADKAHDASRGLAEKLAEDQDLEKQKELYRAIVGADKGSRKQDDGDDAGFVRDRKVKERKAEKRHATNDAYYDKKTGKPGVKKKRSKKRTALIIIICILILAGCAAAAFFLYLHNLTGKMDIVDTSYKDFDISSQVEKDLKNYENIAILGVDARKHESYKGSRSDAIIIARINKKTDKIQLISVMRDSYLQIEGAKGEKSLDKITHAHAYGGPTDTCKALNRSLDLNIEEFVVFNWQSVADLVDAVGGVEVKIDSNEISDLNQYGYESAENVGGTYTPIYNTGKQKLNGAQAVTYCRIRKNSGGDTGRGNRYKEVMSQLLKKASNMKVSKLNKVANEIFPELQTNFKRTAMLTKMAKVSSYEFSKNYGWPKKYYGGIINGVWYAVPKTLESNVKYLHKQAFGQDDYVPTKRCLTISQQIIDKTGIGESSGSNSGQ